MVKRYSTEIRSEVLGKIRLGKKVMEVSKEYGINDMTIRTWLERDTASASDTGSSTSLELSKLKRENEALFRIIGQLTYESRSIKKN